jgi:LmbE family N-acetylglucosaminyl deacetylase
MSVSLHSRMINHARRCRPLAQRLKGICWDSLRALEPAQFFHRFKRPSTAMKLFSRRQLLSQATQTGGAMAIGSTLSGSADAQTQGDAKEPKRKLKIIVTGGHPGDPEYGCGGTIARYADLGHEVVLLYLNRGEWPPADEGASRVAEAKKACEILGAKPLYAGQINSKAIVDASHYEAFRKIIEAENPNAVFTHWPIDNHADHRAISMLAYDAWLKLEKKFAFYYYEVSSGEDTVQFAPSHYVDITKTEPRKRRACYAHASQTPDRYYALQEQVTRFRGIESGHRFAEGFIRHVQSPDFELPLG